MVEQRSHTTSEAPSHATRANIAELTKKTLLDAPKWLTAREATEWANGYNAALRDWVQQNAPTEAVTDEKETP